MFLQVLGASSCLASLLGPGAVGWLAVAATFEPKETLLAGRRDGAKQATPLLRAGSPSAAGWHGAALDAWTRWRATPAASGSALVESMTIPLREPIALLLPRVAAGCVLGK